MIIKFKLTVALNLMFKRTKTTKQIVGSHLRCAYNHVLLEKTSWLYQASVNSSCALNPHPPLPSGLTPAHQHFFALDGKFPGMGTIELSNPPRWGRKKWAKAPSSVNTATFFIDCTIEQCRFKHFNVRLFVLSNVFLCKSARIRVKTSRRDDMRQFMVLVLI